jgi:predicted nucleic acid-binding Zn ribbon protein
VLLGAHAWHSHGLLARQYRKMFGLRSTTALASESFRARARRQADVVFRGHTEGQERIRRLTTAERRAQALGRTWPLEAREDPSNIAQRQAAALRAGSKMRELHATGAWTPPRPRDLAAAGQRGNARKRELLKDPAYRAWYSQHISEGQRGRRFRNCSVCGSAFWARSSRRTCSANCEDISRVQTGVATQKKRVQAAMLKT